MALPVAAPPAAMPRPRRDGLTEIADRVLAGCSLVPVAPVLDVRAFGWTGGLRDPWRPIRDQARRA